jgi:hypothetical protein
MMPSPSAFDGEQTVSASTPREIRAALIGEEIAHFDREYRRARAAQQCGLSDVPPGAKALWGQSAEEARGTYRQWQKRRGRK